MDISDELRKLLEDNGYYFLTEIDGKICGLMDYMYTCGLVVGLDDCSYERRYCYPSRVKATIALRSYQDVSNTHPSGEWIKCKGRFQGQHVDLLNPELTE